MLLGFKTRYLASDSPAVTGNPNISVTLQRKHLSPLHSAARAHRVRELYPVSPRPRHFLSWRAIFGGLILCIQPTSG